MPRMARMPIPLIGGVWKDDTPSTAEAYATDSSWFRFHRNKWQVCGGYETATDQTFTGIVRGAHAWADNQGDRIVGFGTAAKVYAFYRGDITEITPLKSKGFLTNPFTTTSGSAVVLVTHVDHGLKTDDVVTYSLADAAGGITLDGNYTVTLDTKDRYYVTHSGNASSSATGGGTVLFEAEIDEGRVDGIGGLGYGTGIYNSGVYGVTTEGDINPRSWAVQSWGQNGLFLPENGALYEWQPRSSYPELVTNGTFTGNADGWTLGTGYAYSSNAIAASAGTGSDLEQGTIGVLTGGVTYILTFTATASAGSFVFRVTTDPSGSSPTDIQYGASITKSGTYTFRFTAPDAPTKIKFAKDSSFAGTIDTVSIKVVDTAYRLHDAPPYARHMFVDGTDRVILLGTNSYTANGYGDFSGMLVRWSDIRNNRTWDPDTSNNAGFETLSGGSKLIAGLALKAENVLWSDSGMFSMRPISAGYDFKVISGAAGLIGSRAVAELDGVAFWWGTDNNFHIYQGGRPQIIGNCTVLRDVTDNISANQQAKIECGINPQYSEVYWLYPDARDGDGTECSRAVVYNWGEQIWYTHALTRTEWVRPGIFRNPIAFGTDGMIYSHEFGNSFNGSALTAYLETGGYELAEGDTLFQVQNIIPDFEEQTGAMSIKIYGRNWSQDSWVLKETLTSTVGKLDNWCRVKSRQMKFRFDMDSAPAFCRFGTIKMLGSTTGARR